MYYYQRLVGVFSMTSDLCIVSEVLVIAAIVYCTVIVNLQVEQCTLSMSSFSTLNQYKAIIYERITTSALSLISIDKYFCDLVFFFFYEIPLVAINAKYKA